MAADLEKAKANPNANKILVAIFLSFVSLGVVFYHLVEKWNWLDSAYFTIITLATVGYGDFVPKTAAGKIFTMFYVFVGIGIFVYAANNFLKNRIDRRIEIGQNRRGSKKGES